MHDLNWIDCDSSNVAAIAYDEPNQSLYVRFKSGGTYRYDNIPLGEWEGLLSAESKGRYLHRFISGKQQYPCTKL